RRRCTMAPKRRRRHSTRLTGSTRPATCAPARSTRSTWRACSRSAPFYKRQGRPKESSKGSGEAGALAPASLVPFDTVSTPATIEDVERRLRERRYIGDRSLATSIFLALKLQKPLFIEGEAGVGKTEAAKVMAEVLGARLIRLQCYEGIDLAHAVYEWNYPRQLLHIRLMGEGEDRRAAEREIFSSEFLLRRPLPDAIDTDGLAREVAALVQGLRGMDLYKVPGVAETLDWARSLAALGATRIDPGLVSATMGAALKYQEDLDRVREQVPALVEKAKRA